ncbi:MAG TPA: hypothetical protein VJQ43_06100, partial [Thermoplasmata archaeon]|nr:hypothetical protein [Thermoplasmata archaeon]
VLLVLTVAPGPFATSSGVPSLPDRAPITAAARPMANTSINDIIQLNTTLPAGTFSPGTLLQVTYRVSLVTVPVTPSATVYVPGLLASFPASPAPLNLFLPPHNLTMGSGATVTASPTAFVLRNTTSFNASRSANLNSELVALMSSEPFGNASVVVQWNWTMRTAGGAVTTSGWGPANSTPIHPAQIAFLQSLSPRSVVPPAPITACLTGPIQGRTFSLHAETPKPFDDFVANTTRNPIHGPSTFCLTVVIPASITPQNILMHVWDYESVTLLIYIVKVKVVNGTSAAGPSVPLPKWAPYANGLIGIGALGVGIAVVLAVRREPPAPQIRPTPPSRPRT